MPVEKVISTNFHKLVAISSKRIPINSFTKDSNELAQWRLACGKTRKVVFRTSRL